MWSSHSIICRRLGRAGAALFERRRAPHHPPPSGCAAASAAMPLRPIASARKLRAVSADCVAAPSARRLAARGSHLVTRTSAMAPVAGSCRRPRQRRAAPLAPRRRSSCRNYCPALPTMTFRASLAVKCAILTQSRSYNSPGSFGRVKECGRRADGGRPQCSQKRASSALSRRITLC